MSGWPKAGSGSSAGVGEITDGTNAATGNVKVDSPLNTITTVVTPGPGGPLALDINFQGELVDTIQWGLNVANIGAGLTSELATLYGTTPYVAKVQLQGGSLFTSTTVALPSGTNLEGAGWSTTAYISPTANANTDVMSITGSSEWVNLKNIQIAFENAQSAGDWHSCLVLNTTSAGDFDANHTIERMYFKGATGEGVNDVGNGHGGTQFIGCRFISSAGTGLSEGNYDNRHISCEFQSNGISGAYVYSSDELFSSCQFYNNGTFTEYYNVLPSGSGTVWQLSDFIGYSLGGTFTITVPEGTTAAISRTASAATIATALEAIAGFVGTVTGTGGPLNGNSGVVTLTFSNSKATLTVAQTQTLAAGFETIASGAVWRALNTLTNYSGNPVTDTTNWTYPQRPMNGAGRGVANAAPDFGDGVYINSVDCTFTGCTAEQNTGNGLHITGSRVTWHGAIIGANFCQSSQSYLTSNPNNFALVNIDGTLGAGSENNVVASVVGDGNTPAVRLANGASGNTIIINGAGWTTIFSSDTTAAAIAANCVIVNGIVYGGVSPVNAVATSGAAQTLNAFQMNRYVLSTSCTFTLPAAVAGSWFTAAFVQPAAGGPYTPTITSANYGAAGTPTWSTGASKKDIVVGYCDDGSTWDVALVALGSF